MGSTLLEYITNGEIVPKRVMKIDGLVATMEAIRHSDWAAVCQSAGLIQQLTRKDIYIYPIVKPKMSFKLYFLHHPRRRLTLAARCCLDILARQLAKVRASWNEIYRWDSYDIEATIPDLQGVKKTFVV
jgi:DNA-binding transcriptional LysR family regulator